MLPLRAIINLCVALRIHPNTLTLIGVIVNVAAAWALGFGGFMERPERIVLFMIGAVTNRMAGVLWVVLVLSILAVANRIYYTYLELNRKPMPSRQGVAGFFNRAFFWTDERATLPYDLWVIAILAFVWLVPPDWLGDPMAHDQGLVAWLMGNVRN